MQVMGPALHQKERLERRAYNLPRGEALAGREAIPTPSGAWGGCVQKHDSAQPVIVWVGGGD